MLIVIINIKNSYNNNSNNISEVLNKITLKQHGVHPSMLFEADQPRVICRFMPVIRTWSDIWQYLLAIIIFIILFVMSFCIICGIILCNEVEFFSILLHMYIYIYILFIIFSNYTNTISNYSLGVWLSLELNFQFHISYAWVSCFYSAC